MLVNLVLVMMLVHVLSRSVPTGAVIAQRRQTAIIREGDKVSTAAGLALLIIVTEGAIAAIKVTPHFAVGHAHWHLKAIQRGFFLRVTIECLPPCRVLASGRCNAELLFTPDIDAFGRAGTFGHPSWVDMRRDTIIIFVHWLSLIGLLLEMLEEGRF